MSSTTRTRISIKDKGYATALNWKHKKQTLFFMEKLIMGLVLLLSVAFQTLAHTPIDGVKIKKAVVMQPQTQQVDGVIVVHDFKIDTTQLADNQYIVAPDALRETIMSVDSWPFPTSSCPQGLSGSGKPCKPKPPTNIVETDA